MMRGATAGVALLILGSVGALAWWVSREGAPPDGFAIEYVFVSDNWRVADHVLEDNGGEMAEGMECSHHEGIMATVRNEHGAIIGAEAQSLLGTVNKFQVSPTLSDIVENENEGTPLPSEELEFMCILRLQIPLSEYAEFYQLDPPFHHQTVLSHDEAVDRELLVTSQGPIPEHDPRP